MRAVALFRRWLPTAVGTALVAELPLVTVSAARSAEPGQALAALGIGMSVLLVVNAPALASAGLVVVASDAGDARLRRHALLVGLLRAVLLLAIALVPPVLAGLRLLLGIDEDLTSAIRWCLLGLVPNPLGVALRRYLHGRLIRAGRTRPIAWATLTRIAASAALAWLAVSLLPEQGAAAGALALGAGAYTEAVLLALVVRRLPRTPRGTRPLVRRHAQLTVPWLLNNLPAMVTTVGVAHAAQAAGSLVVWPVIYHLAVLFSGPLADWDTVSAAANRRDVRVVTLWLAGGIGGLFTLAVVTGLDTQYVREFSAVPAGPAALGLAWLPLLLPMPVLWALRGALRGRIMAGPRAGALVVAGAAHLVVLASTAAALGVTGLPGVAVGALAVVAGLAAEVAVLGTQAATVVTGQRAAVT